MLTQCTTFFSKVKFIMRICLVIALDFLEKMCIMRACELISIEKSS